MQERRKPGRPKGATAGPTKDKVHITIDPGLREWAMKQPGGMSVTVRKCLEAMAKADRQQ